MSRDTVIIVGTSAASILGLLIGTQYLGIYISLIVFLLFYLRFIGRHDWPLTISLAICVPFFIFCLFEIALTIPLPKAITDPVFYPVYDLVYAKNFKEQLVTLQHSIVFVPLLAVLGVMLYWIKKWIGRRKFAHSDATQFSDAAQTKVEHADANQVESLSGKAP